MSSPEGQPVVILSRLAKTVVVPHLFTAVIAAALFATTSFYVPSLLHPVCQEGGEYVGNPVAFYLRCNGPLIPGDGQGREDPEFRALLLAVDAFFWYFTAFAAMALLRVGVRNLRK